MKVNYAIILQLVLACAFLFFSVDLLHVRKFTFGDLRPAIASVCLVGILYIQMLKILKDKEKKIKEKLKLQSQLINSLILKNSMNTRLVRDIAIPRLFEQSADELVNQLHDSGLTIPELSNYGFDKNIISQYELLYYLNKVKEKKDLLDKPSNSAVISLVNNNLKEHETAVKRQTEKKSSNYY
ncbi:MAG: hypothetical protein QM731_04680 [Chitinophagaceae bacterium]